MNTRAILVLNAGSSSLKFSLFRAGNSGALELAVRGQVDSLGERPRLTARDGGGRMLAERELPAREAATPADALKLAGAWLRRQFPAGDVAAVGHRVVHGGSEFSAPVLLDAPTCAALERLVPLAPLHLPSSLGVIQAVSEWRPGVRQVACFDTAFHRTHPLLADLYALPWEYYEAGVRRYGFHGLSYEYIASALPQVAPEIARARVVIAHLGNGASLCALRDGRSVDSTMGFSVLEGIPMSTRPGALDPGVVLYLLNHRRLAAREVEDLLYYRSGLLGLSGVSHDVRLLLESTEPRAQLALDYFVHRIAREIAALAAALGGLDGLVFTAGIGENSAVLRRRILERCAWLGVAVDTDANERGGPRISAAGSRVSAWVVPTNEELMIARHTLACIRARAPGKEPSPSPTRSAARNRQRGHGRRAPERELNLTKESAP